MTFFLKKQNRTSHLHAFSLIEIMVSVALFSVVMVISVGSLLIMIDANRKAQALQSVMNNLNFALESMVRNARVGTDFHCVPGVSITPPSDIETPRDCEEGGALFAFEGQFGTSGDSTDQIVYRVNGTQLERSTDGGGSFIAVTAPEVVIDTLTFYVRGAPRGDERQPHMVVTIQGRAGVNERSQTKFNLQGGATQRVLDL